MSNNSLVVLRKRGYLKKSDGVWEDPEAMFRRVARLIASADKTYKATREELQKTEQDFFQMMSSYEYLSGSVLLNASRHHKQFSACYVLPLSDSLEDIYDQLRNAALILRTGGGVGIPLTNLRPRGSRVEKTGGISSGAVSFMRLFNFSAATIAEAATRRPAMMGALRVDHPDILEFIMSKEDPSSLYHFNISVGATTTFMEKVRKGSGSIHLSHPNDGLTERDIDVMELWNLIATQAWKVGDPGMIFLDRMNKDNPTPELGMFETTNVCGEQPLLPYESCNLGNINLGKFVKISVGPAARHPAPTSSLSAAGARAGARLASPIDTLSIDWSRLEHVVRLGVHFQDNVIDLCDYPIPQLTAMAKMTRKIGIGVMGWADMLIKLGIRYDSEEALKLAKKVAKFIQETARDESVKLGKKRGSFPAFSKSVWKKRGFSHMRNATVNTVAPTGTISIIAGCSSGIEPLFALAYRRENILDLGTTSLLEVNKDFEEQIHMFGKVEKIEQEVSEKGSCQQVAGLSKKIKDMFRTAMDISYDWHIRMQAAWQQYTDTAVSKTVNLPNTATVEDVKCAYLLAYEIGCKGVTIYRDRCRNEQVLNVGSRQQGTRAKGQGLSAEVCPECRGELVMSDGCAMCPECGYSKCIL